MLKRVKSRAYKSKWEFKDDLDLIWSNCLMYNAALVCCLDGVHCVNPSSFLGIPSDLPGQVPSMILIKPNRINGHSRSLSSTPALLLLPTKSMICIPPSMLSKKKKLNNVPFLDSPMIVHTVDGMSLFKAADEELDIKESNSESRLREFTLEDPDEFADPDLEEEAALVGDKWKLYASIHACHAELIGTRLTGKVPLWRGFKKALDNCLLQRSNASGRMTFIPDDNLMPQSFSQLPFDSCLKVHILLADSFVLIT